MMVARRQPWLLLLLPMVVGLSCGPDGPVDPVCTPITCEEQGAECGAVEDGCGNTVECGGCEAPLLCGGEGEANRCGLEGAPKVTIHSGPTGLVTSSFATLVFECDLENCATECSIAGLDLKTCVSPLTYAGLLEGDQSFLVRGIAAGVAGPVARWSWRVDTRPPTVLWVSGPEELTRQRSATFTFECDEPGCTYECSLNGAAFAPCTSPATRGPLGDGAHLFRVRATDPAAHLGEAAEYGWEIDTRAPVATLTSTLVEEDTAVFTFACDEEDCTFECSLDGALFEPCEAPVAFEALAEGEHRFHVRATDRAGNSGPEAFYEWTYEIPDPDPEPEPDPDPEPEPEPEPEPPEVTFVHVDTSGAHGRFEFVCDRPDCLFWCSHNEAAFEPCESPIEVRHVPTGANSFRVYAEDLTGLQGPVVVHEWVR